MAVGPKADGTANAGPGAWLDQSIGTGPPLVGGDTASDSLLFGLVVALIVLIVIATMFITSEYRRGLIRTTFAATPNRSRVLAAKAVVVGLGAFAIGAAAAAAAIALAEHFMNANRNYIFPAGPLTVARIIAGTGALVALTAIATLGIATILRRSAGTILVGGCVRPARLHGPGHHRPDLFQRRRDLAVPANAGCRLLRTRAAAPIRARQLSIHDGERLLPLSPWAGLLVLCAYAAAALAVARFALLRRDA